MLAGLDERYRIEDLKQVISPSLIVFREIVRSNLERMVAIAGSPQRLRPHCKTHKMAAVIALESELGITRHKCATIAEAEMLIDAGVRDVLLAYNPVGPNIERVAALAERYEDLQLAVTGDHLGPLRQLDERLAGTGARVEVLLDLDPGLHRTGIPPGPAARELYRRIADLAYLRPGGFHLYDGHHRQRDRAERQAAVDRTWAEALELWEQLKAERLPLQRIVAGGTGSFPCFAEHHEPFLELSPGTVVFHDAGYGENFPDMAFEPAALILTRVISKPQTGLLTLDLGHKACAADPPAGNRLAFPELPDKEEVLQSEEHLVIRTSVADRYEPGDELLAIPWHICPTTAVHDHVLVYEQGQQVDRWSVTARNRTLTV